MHWNAYGREFLSAHRHLDQVLDEPRELEDAVAERAATVGNPPDASTPAVVELAKLWEVALRVQQRPELLGTLDAASQDVLVDVGRKLEEQGWMMWAQLPDHGHRLIVSSPPNVTG